MWRVDNISARYPVKSNEKRVGEMAPAGASRWSVVRANSEPFSRAPLESNRADRSLRLCVWHLPVFVVNGDDRQRLDIASLATPRR